MLTQGGSREKWSGHSRSGLVSVGTALSIESGTGDESPLSQFQVVSAGFQATPPNLILCGLRRRSYFVDCFQLDGHLVGLGKRRMRFPPLIESDSINLMFAGFNLECGRKVPRESLLAFRKEKLLSVFCGQFNRHCLIAPTVPVFPHDVQLRRNILKYNVQVTGLLTAPFTAPTDVYPMTGFGNNREQKRNFLGTGFSL